MSDLTRKTEGICGKASEVERQLRDRVLAACCEEQMAKLSRQEAKMMEEVERMRQPRVRGMVTWADVEDEGDFEGRETGVELGGSTEVVEDGREEQSKESGRRHNRSKTGREATRRRNCGEMVREQRRLVGWRSRKRQSRGETDEK